MQMFMFIVVTCLLFPIFFVINSLKAAGAATISVTKTILNPRPKRAEAKALVIKRVGEENGKLYYFVFNYTDGGKGFTDTQFVFDDADAYREALEAEKDIDSKSITLQEVK